MRWINSFSNSHTLQYQLSARRTLPGVTDPMDGFLPGVLQAGLNNSSQDSWRISNFSTNLFSPALILEIHTIFMSTSITSSKMPLKFPHLQMEIQLTLFNLFMTCQAAQNQISRCTFGPLLHLDKY